MNQNVRDTRFQLLLDQATATALRRLAESEERSQAGQLRHMIRQEAARRGLWTAPAPRLVERANDKAKARP